MDVASFAEIEPEFTARVSRIVWATVATVDARGRPRTRILHPMWEGTTAWILTGRESFKARHLAANPHVSLSYWDPEHAVAYIEATAEWCDDLPEKRRVWDLFKSTPFPYGYDPSSIPGWTAPDAPGFGILKLKAGRIELAGMTMNPPGVLPRRVWRG